MTDTVPTCTCRVPHCPALATHVLLTHASLHGEGWRREAMLASEAPPESQGTVVAGQAVYAAPSPYYCAEHAAERAAVAREEGTPHATAL